MALSKKIEIKGGFSAASVERAYREWLQSPVREVRSELDEADKFPSLVSIATAVPECNAYFCDKIGVGSDDVATWASGESRPAGFVARKIVRDLKTILSPRIQ